MDVELESIVCFSFSLAAQEPMAYVRLIAPLGHLGILILDGLHSTCDREELLSQGDAVVLQREFPMRFDEYQEIVRVAREKKKPVIWEVDDLLFFLPESHPDRQKHSYAFALLPMLQALMEVDAVTVPTSKMRDVLQSYNERVFVVPNYFDDGLWSLKPPVVSKSPYQILTIGYMGTHSHQPDLEYVAPVLLKLLNRYPQQIRLRVWGVQPPPQLHLHPQVDWTPCAYRSYEEFVAFFQTQSADIFIAPLVDHLFNRCKSSLKFFEYSALGAPGVFSRLEPYEEIVQHEQNGMLAYSLDEWEWCLTRLIEDPEMRIRLATNAQTTIREKWLLSENASRWQEVFRSVLDRQGESKEEDSLTFRMVRSINPQLCEAVQLLNARIDQQAQVIEALNREILGYALSKSWRMTRPLRVISRKLQAVRRRDGIDGSA